MGRRDNGKRMDIEQCNESFSAKFQTQCWSGFRGNQKMCSKNNRGMERILFSKRQNKRTH